ncbi:MAG: aspartate--tRNA(Asn) ligase, partial [Thermoplasmata archaeon]|nr:aspartate--tRNA(Asn) ligase [Thermoplasmata archaeon]
MASGLERVFEMAPAFRAESHDTTRHLNEYLSVDVEMSFADEGDAMDVLADAIKAGIERASSSPAYKGPAPPEGIERITYDDALGIIAEGGIEVPWGSDIDAEALRILAAAKPGFYFIVRWPLKTKPFYVQPDGEYGLGFDLMMGYLEIASGAQRVHDHSLLIERIRALGLDPAGFEFYLKAFRYGIPPHAGWGMGLDRLVQVLVGADNVRECVLFPRDMKRLVP